jgi:polyisoprenoid-binding protein YceI
MTTERWAIDTAHSSVDFVARHMMLSKVRGTFTDWNGAIDVNLEDPAQSSVTATIVVASIETRDRKRDTHLLSADFFDAAVHPLITFTSRRVEIQGTKLKVIGDLSIRGVIQDVALDVEYGGLNLDPWGNKRVHYSAKISLNRKDFGLAWNQVLETGGVLIGEMVEIEIAVEALRAVVPAKLLDEKLDETATPVPT